MSLLFSDGFDLYNSIPNKGWTFVGSFGSNGSFQFSVGRIGTGQALQVNKGNANGPGAGAVNNLGVNKTTLIMGCAWNNLSYTLPERIFGFQDAGTEQLSVRIEYTNRLQVVRNGTVLATETAATMSLNTWYYIELKVTFSGTTGSYALRRNGAVVAGIPDATGVNTIGTANAFANQIAVMAVNGNVNPGSMAFDDLYLCDNAGTVNNDFLGDIRVLGQLPNAAGTPATTFNKFGAAATNWQSVNDNPNDGDTTYVASSTVGNSETYKYPALPGNTTRVLAVVGTPIARKDDAGGRSLAAHVRSGTVEADGPSSALSTTYAIYEQVMETNPVTGAAWDVPTFNAAEFGPKLAA